MRIPAIIAVALGLLLASVFVVRMCSGTRARQQADDPLSRTADRAAPDRGADWRVELDLEQLSERNPDYEASRLKVVLRNSMGEEIETPDTHFELNGVPLTYAVAQGNYYDRHPYYRLREDPGFRLAADSSYELTMRRTNGPALPFASIRTPKPMLATSFRVPETPATHPRNRDLVISWTGLTQGAEMLIYKTHTFIDDQGNQAIEAGGPYAEDALRERIGARGLPLIDGRYTIPATYLATTAGRNVTAIGIEITATNTGRFLHPVLGQSTVTARRKVVLRVDVVAPRES